jgi:hypothetical protein
MSPTRHMRRLNRSFAAVESGYVRDLGRREQLASGSRRPRLREVPRRAIVRRGGPPQAR